MLKREKIYLIQRENKIFYPTDNISVVYLLTVDATCANIF